MGYVCFENALAELSQAGNGRTRAGRRTRIIEGGHHDIPGSTAGYAGRRL